MRCKQRNILVRKLKFTPLNRQNIRAHHILVIQTVKTWELITSLWFKQTKLRSLTLPCESSRVRLPRPSGATSFPNVPVCTSALSERRRYTVTRGYSRYYPGETLSWTNELHVSVIGRHRLNTNSVQRPGQNHRNGLMDLLNLSNVANRKFS